MRHAGQDERPDRSGPTARESLPGGRTSRRHTRVRRSSGMARLMMIKSDFRPEPGTLCWRPPFTFWARRPTAEIGAVAQRYLPPKGTQRIIAADAHDTEAVAEAGRTVTGG